MSKNLLILIAVLFHLHIHAKSMLVDPLDPLSDPNLISLLFNEVIDTIRTRPDKINETNEEGYTLLQQALINQAYIENKVSEMDYTNGSEKSILDSNMTTIKVLLNNGADPNITFPVNKNSRNKKETQHFLIKAAETSPNNRFPLHIIELLFEYGLSEEVRDSQGYTALMKLIALRHVWRKIPEYRRELIQLVVKNTNNIDAQNKDKNTALHLTIKFSDLETARLLVEHGARLDIQNAEGNNPEETAKFMAGSLPSHKSQRRWYWHFSFFHKTSYKIIKLLQEAQRLLKKERQPLVNGSPCEIDFRVK